MRSRALVAMAVIGGACVTGGWLVQRATIEHTVDGARLFDQVRDKIATRYVDSIAPSRLYRRAIDGLLREIGDPHSRFLTGQRLSRLQESTTGRYEGIGVRIDVRDGWITVVAPLPGTPAERAGILTGDRIVEIDGKNTHGWSSDEAAQAIRGARNTRVRLVIERPGAPSRLTFSVPRREVRVRSVQHVTMLREDVGYVDVDIFSEDTGEELGQAIETLRKRGMKALVVDLRDNPGGLLDQGVEVSELLLDEGQTVVSMRGRTRDANRSYRSRSDQRWRGLPVVVLVDSGSASASEIVAGAWQDHDRAVVIGSVTFGKGSAQSVFPMGDSVALKLTTARWFTPLGRSIDRSPADSASDDLAGVDADSAEDTRPRYRTASGRVLYGGGGIVPDLEVHEVRLTPPDRRFQEALGSRIPQFRDALTSYALALRASGGLPGDFAITPAMRDELWRRMRARGIEMPRQLYDQAPVVDRLLGAEISRYVFGDLESFRRGVAEDRVIQAALDIAAGAADQRTMFERATRRRESGSAEALGGERGRAGGSRG